MNGRKALKEKDTMENQKFMFTPDEIARLFGVSTKHIYNEIGRGRLRAAKFGGTYRISAQELAAYWKRSGADPAHLSEMIQSKENTK